MLEQSKSPLPTVHAYWDSVMTHKLRVFLFRFKQKDAKRSETKRNEAKKMRKQTLSRPEEAKLSKTK
jgi:hypothetical protein